MNLEQQLRAALVPCEPGPEPETVVMRRINAATWRASRGTRRKSGRVILFSTILVVAAAAAMLAVSLLHVPAPAPAPAIAAVAAPGPLPVALPAVMIGEASSAKQFQPVPQPSTERSTSTQTTSVAKPFRVRVLPLQNNATDVTSKDAINLFYKTLLDDLRAVPGLTLNAPDSSGAVAASADYQLNIKGAGPLPRNQFSIDLQVETIGSDGRPRTSLLSSINGEIAPPCAGSVPVGTATSCSDPVNLAALHVEELRARAFPDSPSLRQRWQAQLLDSSLDARQRLNALTNLESPETSAGGTGIKPAEETNALRDPAVVRGAIELVSVATDPAERAQVWRTMRGVRNEDLIQPLTASLRNDADANVRVEAVMTLVAGFASDSRARAAFELTARLDANPLVRAVAQRGLTGDAAWGKYIAVSLKDTSRPDAERIAALFYAVNQPGPVSGLRNLLDDDDAVRALEDLLPSADSLLGGKIATIVLLRRLGSIDHPAVTNIFLDDLANADEPLVRQTIVRQLTSRSSDSRVRVALEKIRTTDSDLQVRQLAADALGTAVTNLSAPPQSPTR